MRNQSKKSRSGLDSRGRVYSVSGIGYGFTGGQTGVWLQPKFSTTLGLDISLGSGHFLLYPSVDFLTFRYNQQISDPDYVYSSQKSRASYTIFTLAFGYRKSLGNFGIYPFAGFGGGLVSEPRIAIDNGNHQAVLFKKTSNTLAAKGGLGLEFRLGQFVIFSEANFLHTFKPIQERKVDVVPIYLGSKSNISSVFTGRRSR